jgi:predicted alpha/beta hydrolase
MVSKKVPQFTTQHIWCTSRRVGPRNKWCPWQCAPSHIRNLWYQYSAPYTLARQGYAVVAPDYAGLGVNRTAEGKFVLHQYTANPAGANDIFFAVEAAQSAFPELSKHFVTMGHS